MCERPVRTRCRLRVGWRLKGENMEVRPIDANALRLNIEIWIQEYTNGTVGNLSLDDVLDYIDTAPTIEVKDNG